MPNLKQQLADLEKVNDKLRKDNLLMRLEIEELVTIPDSIISRSIIEKYRRKRDIRDEQYLAGQN
jgi:hypothetical protein